MEPCGTGGFFLIVKTLKEDFLKCLSKDREKNNGLLGFVAGGHGVWIVSFWDSKEGSIFPGSQEVA